MKKTIISLLALVFIYSFTPQETSNTFTDSRDGKVYKTVTIGEQVWMAGNLAYLPSVVGPGTGSETDPYCYVYGYAGTSVAKAKATTNYQTYGVLYNWPAALEACPDGWHLPSDAEWTQLENYLGGWDLAGGKMKEAGTTHWINPNEGATNSSGFTALPGGYRDDDKTFRDISENGYWWSSTQSSTSITTDYVWNRFLDYGRSDVLMNDVDNEQGFSVRCVKGNTLPMVTTGNIFGVGKNTASCSGNVTAAGGAAVTARGVCWSTSQNPTTSNSKTTNGTGLGTYTSNITGLSPNTTYYVRAYATNSQGTTYGEQRTFKTHGSFTDSRDGNQYETVTIGDQVWMAENLAYLPSVVGPNTGSDTDPYCYVYGYNGTNVATAKATTNYQTYGVLYNWPAALEACPDGWHLPSDAEWTQLEKYLMANGYNYDGTDYGNEIAKSMASATGWNSSTWAGAIGNDDSDYDGYRNKSGFTALPGGCFVNNGTFAGIGLYSFWWSSTQNNTDTVWFRWLIYNSSDAERDYGTKTNGFSVRCVQGNILLMVTTGYVFDVGKNTASCSGNVTAGGGAAVTARGVCWSTSQNPTTSNSKTTNGTGLGTYTSNITGLSPNTIYYVRAYATNSQGTAYGEQRTFKTHRSFTDSRDGNQYETVTIGDQVWMAENLAYLPSVVGPNTGSETDPYCYVYGYNGTNVATAKATTNYQTYGVLYNWPAALEACPDGWHLPSDAEWTQLGKYLIANGYNYDGTTSGNKISISLASATGWNSSTWEGAIGNDDSDYDGYRNKSGFTALPGGYRGSNGTFYFVGGSGDWWSSTERGEDTAWSRPLYYEHSDLPSYNSYSRAYGFSVRCLRDNNLLSITTGQVTNITTTTATCSGNVTSDGGLSVTARGVCWSTSQNPTTSNSKTTNGTGLGTYTSNITGLSPNTTYYVRAYATNSQGTAYGEQKTFKTQQEQDPGDGSFTDSRDGNQYKTVTIGSQVWMAENLAYLPSVVGPGTGFSTYPYYYVNGYAGTSVATAKATANYKTYGVLYNWTAAMNGAASSATNPSGVQGVCPDGWHLPSDAEWTTLTTFLGGWKVAGGKMKETGTSHWDSPNAGADNSSGFTALPGGYRGSSGAFGNVGSYGYWWSSSQSGTVGVCYSSLYYDNSSVRRGSYSKENGFSVRCVKGNTLPMVTTGNVFGVGKNTASCSGNVTAAGGAAVTARGVCWSTSQNPTTSNSKTTNGTGLGTYTSNITGLSPNTTYYVRAYATNSQGTAYGEQRTFKIHRSFTDSRDGKVYKMVTIGEQVWMAENLAYLPSVSLPTSGSNGSPYYYVYDYYGTSVATAKATTNYQTYGVLYNWPAALEACPDGWHLPSDAEWTELETYLTNNGYNYDGSIGVSLYEKVGSKIAISLASATGRNSLTSEGAIGNNNTDYDGYRNKTGFTALLGGYRPPNGPFSTIGLNGYWWSSTQSNENNAWTRALSSNNSHVARLDVDKEDGFSVRCLRDNNLLSITTGQVKNITTTTATCSGNVTSDGGLSVTARGVCWSTSQNPTTSNSKTTNGTGLGTYTINITGLSPNTTYYVRAYATNSQGTAYGEQRTFKTQQEQDPGDGNFTDFRDGKVYKTVTIGSQVWMAENLAYLPSVVGPATGSETVPYYYVYGYNGTNVAEAKANDNYTTYGVLYNWPAAMNGAASSDANPSGVQGICPAGWHLPSDKEWRQLTTYLYQNGYNYDGSLDAGVGKISKSMASNSGWNPSDNLGAPGNSDYDGYRNKSGFTALPGGYRGNRGAFFSIGDNGYWWSSTQYNVIDAWFCTLNYGSSLVNVYANSQAYGFSVRCVKGNILTMVTTGNVFDVGKNIASCSGNVTAAGGTAVTARGVCWSTSKNPTTSNSKTTNGSGMGTYTSNITGLSPNTTYYVRAYATNSQGTAYGEQRTFKTQQGQDPGGGSFTDSRDGKVYRTITIGEQVWMAENLAYLPSVVGPTTGSKSTAYYYVYGYNGTNVATAKATANYKTYGVLYSWPAALEACPDGWHLPSHAEWTQLEKYLIANGYNYDGTDCGNEIAISLASATGWNSSTDTGAIGNNDTAYDAYRNKSGFTALPGGFRGHYGAFSRIGYYGDWWSSTQYDTDNAWYRYLGYYYSNVYRNCDSKDYGFSVRCLRD